MSLTPPGRGLAALALSLIVAGCGTSQQAESGAPPPRALGAPKLLASAPRVSLFAQDDGQIAWWGGDGCAALHVRTIATGSETRIPHGRKCALAYVPGGDDPEVSSLFAFAGGRALWGVHAHGHFAYEYVQTASLSDPTIRSVGEGTQESDEPESGYIELLSGMVGDRGTLVYIEESVPWRVVGATNVSLPGTPGAFAVAVSGRLAAFLHSAGRDDNDRPFSDDTTPVEVRDVRTGELVGRFKHSGRATAVALAPGFVALLVSEDKSTRIETYTVEDGERQAQATVPSDATDISLAGETVVFRSANTIYVLNATSGRQSEIAVAKGTPIGLSIEGRRIAWAENGRIVAVYLSAS